uniref:Uncharacterized protein n=1 Tax=Knipowitschia caucasica TaxID=637954 RepID=A0AAV2LUD4_KNICA
MPAVPQAEPQPHTHSTHPLILGCSGDLSPRCTSQGRSEVGGAQEAPKGHTETPSPKGREGRATYSLPNLPRASSSVPPASKRLHRDILSHWFDPESSPFKKPGGLGGEVVGAGTQLALPASAALARASCEWSLWALVVCADAARWNPRGWYETSPPHPLQLPFIPTVAPPCSGTPRQMC